jgi:uridine monophosphate synthetase
MPPSKQGRQVLFDTNVIFDTNALFDSGCIQFGNFPLKSGYASPIRIDLWRTMGNPRLLRQAARAMSGIARDLAFDYIVPTPHASLPIGVALALELNQPLIQLHRVTNARHMAVEGSFKSGSTALLIDDLIIQGSDKLEAIAVLKTAGLTVQDVLVMIDWEQGGAENLAERGYHLHAVLQLTKVLEVLVESTRITPSQHAAILAYLREA